MKLNKFPSREQGLGEKRKFISQPHQGTSVKMKCNLSSFNKMFKMLLSKNVSQRQSEAQNFFLVSPPSAMLRWDSVNVQHGNFDNFHTHFAAPLNLSFLLVWMSEICLFGSEEKFSSPVYVGREFMFYML